MSGAAASAALQVAPRMRRRLACFAYEGVLLFGVVMAAGLVYGIVTEQRHALIGTFGLRVFLFFVLGAYFVGFWSTRGQTLPMQTWQIRVVTRAGGPLSWQRATARYLLSWLWFVPALAILALTGLRGSLQAFGVIATGVLAYAALAWLRADRQYWHDVACGTRLVDWRVQRGTDEPDPSEVR